MTLEDLLRNSKTIDFRVRAQPGPNGVICYIHPQGVDGGTIDFVVNGDSVAVFKREIPLPETRKDAA